MAERRVGHGIGGSIVNQQACRIGRACRFGGDVPVGEGVIVMLGQEPIGCGHSALLLIFVRFVIFGGVEILEILIPEVKILIVDLTIIRKGLIRFMGRFGFIYLGGE